MAINLSELGLQPGQDELLLNLEKGRPVSTPQIAARLGVRHDTAAKLLSRLVQQRLAMRVESLADARSTVVAITASGLEMQARIRSMMAQIDDQLRAGGDTRKLHAEIDQLNGRLSRLLTPHL